MTKAEMHYFNCSDENCEFFACVARRDYERQLANLNGELEHAQRNFADAVSGCCDCPMFKASTKEGDRLREALAKLIHEMDTTDPGSNVKWIARVTVAKEIARRELI